MLLDYSYCPDRYKLARDLHTIIERNRVSGCQTRIRPPSRLQLVVIAEVAANAWLAYSANDVVRKRTNSQTDRLLPNHVPVPQLQSVACFSGRGSFAGQVSGGNDHRSNKPTPAESPVHRHLLAAICAIPPVESRFLFASDSG